VLRAVVGAGVTHVDTSDFYGPAVVNELIKDALHPYPADLHIVTKVGARRDEKGGWIHAQEPADLKAQVRENLQHLGLEALDVVNLRAGGQSGTYRHRPGHVTRLPAESGLSLSCGGGARTGSGCWWRPW
jgi:pyridoxine 4-dehydrogenase